MKNMRNTIYAVAGIVLLLFTASYAVDIGDDTRFDNIVTFNSPIQEQTEKTDGTSLCFEGSTVNAFTTCFLITDPTANRVITFGNSSFTAGATNAHSDLVTITKVTAGTNTVQDALTIDISGADTTTGFGAGIAFKLEDDTGTTTEEHGSVDVVITDGTSTTEDSDMVFKHMVNGDVTETFRLVAGEASDAGDYFQFLSNTTELNGEITTGIFKLISVGTEAAGLGATHEYWMVDAGGSEVQAEFATVFTTITTGQEDVDLVWRQNDNGTVNETLRIVADADGTVEGTRMEFTSNSAETDGVNDLLVLKASGGTTVAGFGVGIDMQAEFADGVETAGKLEAVWTDVSTGSEDADVVISAKDAGATVELVRFDSDGSILMEGATADGNQTIITAADVGADVTLTLPGVTGNIRSQVGLSAVPNTEVVTTTNALTSAECGSTYFLNNAVGFVSTLPSPSGITGCEFTFIVQTAPTSGALNIYTGGADIMVGHIDDIADAAGSSDDNADTLNYANSTSLVGDKCYMITNGTSWYYDCITGAAAGITSATN